MRRPGSRHAEPVVCAASAWPVGQTMPVATELPRGLYEILITKVLENQLVNVDHELIRRQRLRSAEAADRIAQLLARQVERALDAVPEADRVAVGVEVAHQLLATLATRLPRTEPVLDAPRPPGDILHAIGERRPDGSVHTAGRPLIPLLDTTLLTNAPGEPTVRSQIDAEIASADSIDVVMAFIRRSGIRPLVAALRDHCA